MPNQLYLLGLPKVALGETSSAIRLNNPARLLVYLAIRADWVSRSELAFLFRPDEAEATALTHIRVLVHRAKQLDWAANLEIDTRRVRFLVDTDVAAFRHAYQKRDWAQASQLYTDRLLGDYSAADMPTYSAWLDLERSDLEHSYQTALHHYADDLEQQGNVAGAAQVLYALLKLDRLAEDVMRRYLKTLYLAGQRDKALKAYADFCKALLKEYETEPLEDTQVLVSKIRDNTPLATRAVNVVSTVAEPKPLNNLPKPSTRFVGRQQDLVTLSQQLRDEGCRLLTLVGLGGTGKTRLALELARQLQADYADGVCFVPLAALSSAEGFASTLAQSLGLTLAPQQDASEQVLRFIADKQILLLIDNFEHVLAAAPTVSRLLAQTENLTLLVTSRESLNIGGEWLYDVDGLAYPDSDESAVSFVAAVDDYDAVALFASSARRVAPRLSLTDSDTPYIAQICQRVQGLPLALELAASWTRIMSVERIASELASGYELLESSSTDLPERHRSLKTILDKTWQELSEKKRQTLTSFAVFAGGCTLEAAEAVTATTFSLLLSLVNEALLVRSQTGRFEMHALVKQYALDMLKRQPAALAQSCKQHADYYSASLNKLELNIVNVNKARLESFAADSSNYTQAWYYWLAQQQLDRVDEMNQAMYSYYFTSGRVKEGLELFSRARQQVSRQSLDQSGVAAELCLARLQLSEGRLLRSLGESKQAKLLFETALSLAEKYAETGLMAAAHSYIGDCAYELGDSAHAKRCFETAGAYFAQLDDWKGLARINNMLGNLTMRQGDYDTAKNHYAKTLAASKELGDAMGGAVALNNMANLAEAQGAYQEAVSYYLECLAVFEDISFLRGVAVAKTNLGLVYLKLADVPLAKQYLFESLTMKQKLNDAKGIIYSQVNLADTFIVEKDYARAEALALEAFATALDKGFVQTIVESYATLIELCKHHKEYALLRQLLEVLLSHPVSNPQIHGVLRKHEAALPKKAPAGAASAQFKGLVNTILLTLS